MWYYVIWSQGKFKISSRNATSLYWTISPMKEYALLQSTYIWDDSCERDLPVSEVVNDLDDLIRSCVSVNMNGSISKDIDVMDSDDAMIDDGN